MREGQIGGRVEQDTALRRQAFEPGSERGEAAELRADGERHAVGLAVVEQVALVALQDRLGDLARIGQAPLVALGDEPPQRDAPAADGVWTVARHQQRLEVRLHRLGQREVGERIGFLAGPSGTPAGLAEPFPPGRHRSVIPA